MPDDDKKVDGQPDDQKTPSQEELDAAAAKLEAEKKNGKHEESKDSPTLNLKNLEKLDDGTYQIKAGASIYTGKSPDEVLEKMFKGIEDKDKAYQDSQEKLRKLKADSSIRESEESTEELPPTPKYEDFVVKVFREKGIDTQIAGWSATDKRWDELQEEKGLKDRHIMQMIADRDAALQQARKLFDAELTKSYNVTSLRQEITPAVKEIVVESGLDPDDFGEFYLQVLQDPKSRYSNGELNTSAILRSVSKEVLSRLKKEGATSSDMKKMREQAEKEIADLKAKLGSGSRTTDKDQKPKPKLSATGGIDWDSVNKMLSKG